MARRSTVGLEGLEESHEVELAALEARPRAGRRRRHDDVVHEAGGNAVLLLERRDRVQRRPAYDATEIEDHAAIGHRHDLRRWHIPGNRSIIAGSEGIP